MPPPVLTEEDVARSRRQGYLFLEIVAPRLSPARLEANGMRGHKHLAEYLMAQSHRQALDPDAGEEPGMAIARAMALAGSDHPLEGREGSAFARAVAPWLRTLVIAADAGIERPDAISGLEAEMERILAYRASLSRPDMRLALGRSLFVLGLGPAPAVAGEAPSFTINSWPSSRRLRADGTASPYLLRDADAYAVLHEVMEATGEGAHAPVSGADWRWVAERLAEWLPEYAALGDTDLLAETLVALRLLGTPPSDPAWRAHLAVLVGMQRGNGSFGDYEEERFAATRSGYDLDIGKYLHTTEVALWALELAR